MRADDRRAIQKVSLSNISFGQVMFFCEIYLRIIALSRSTAAFRSFSVSVSFRSSSAIRCCICVVVILSIFLAHSQKSFQYDFGDVANSDHIDHGSLNLMLNQPLLTLF
jgi:hypothetical protein